MMNKKYLSIVAAFMAICLSAQAQLFNLETSHIDGRFTYSFLKGSLPVTVGLSKQQGLIFFEVSDATNIKAPDNWDIQYDQSGFVLSYNGPLEVYPLGFEDFEVSFDSNKSIEEIGSNESNYTGLITGMLVLKNGQYRFPSTATNSGVSFSNPVGYSFFYYGMPPYDGPSITAKNMIDIFGFSAEDIKPISSKITVDSSNISIHLENIFDESIYTLQFNNNLDETNWVNIRTFTSEDLDEQGIINVSKEGVSGFFRVTLL